MEKNFFNKETPKKSLGDNEWIPLSLAARLTPYSPEYLSLLARKKKLPAKKIDNIWFTTKAILEDYMRRQMLREQVQNGKIDPQKINTGTQRFVGEQGAQFIREEKDEKTIPSAETEKDKPSSFEEKTDLSVFPPRIISSKNKTIEPPHETKNNFAIQFIKEKVEKIHDSISGISNKLEKVVPRTENAEDLTPPFLPKLNKKGFSKEISESNTTKDQFTPRQEIFTNPPSAQPSPISREILSGQKIPGHGIFGLSRGAKMAAGIIGGTTLLFFMIFPVPIVFGVFDLSLDGIRNWIKDSQTVLGYRPGTHANEILLLDEKGDISLKGNIETDGQLRSFAPQGVAPLEVVSSTTVKNLSAEFVDGQSAENLIASTTERILAEIRSAGLSVDISAPKVIERIITERISVSGSSGVSGKTLDERLNQLENSLKLEIYRLSSQSGQQGSQSSIAYAPSQRIDNLNNVTIAGATISNSTWNGGTINNASGSFTSLTVNSLSVSGSSSFATSTFSGDVAFDSDTLFIDSINNRVGIGTSSPSDTFSINGPSYLAPIASPAVSSDRLYNVSGDLYWAGNVIGGATTGTWTTDGTSVWRAGGNVGVGTTSPFATLSIAGDGYFDGNLTVSNLTATGTISSATTTAINFLATGSTTLQDFTFQNATGTSATTTNFFSSFFRSVSATIDILSASVSALTDVTITRSTTTNATTTNLYASNITNDNITATSSANLGTTTITNLSVTNTSTSTFAGGLTVAGEGFVYQQATGNVGIGTTTPGTKLDIYGTGGTQINLTGGLSSGFPVLQLIDQQSGGKTWNIENGRQAGSLDFFLGGVGQLLTINSVGSVGIGTTSPYSKLTTWGTGSLFEAVTNASSTIFSIGQTGATTTNFAISNLANALLSTNSLGSVVATTSPTISGSLTLSNIGKNMIITSDGSGALVASSTPSATAYLATSTTATSTFAGGFSAASSLYVLQNGNVGVGTTSPGAKLQVVGSALFNNGGVNDRGVTIAPTWTSATDNGVTVTAYGVSGQSGSNGTFRFNNQTGNLVAIDSTGNVGVGTTSPWGLLSVNPTASLGSAPQFVVGSSTATNFIVTNGGNVGIKTLDTTYGSLTVEGASNSTYHYGQIVSQDSTAMATGVGGGISFFGKYTTAGAQAVASSIWSAKDNATSGQYGFSLNFGTRTNGSASVGADLTIDSSGNVGIGTTSPGGTLDISSVAGSDSTLILSDGDVNHGITGIAPTNAYGKLASISGTSGGLFVTGVRSGDAAPLIIRGIIGSASPTVSAVNFWAGKQSGTNAVDLANTEKAYTFGDSTGTDTFMTILGSGNVGIGTTTPSQKLEVTGNMAFSANPGSNRYLLVDQTNTGTTKLTVQAGAGSAAYGGAINLYGQADASKPGWVQVGVGSGAGTAGTATEGRFTVNDSGLGAGTDLFTVLRTGNVGIGTTTPNTLLSLVANGPVLSLGSSGTTDPRIDFYDQNTTTIGASMFLDQDQDTLRILRTASGSATDGIAINASGNVGIGIATPTNKLHILGASSDTISSANLNVKFQGGGGNGLGFGTIASSPFTSYIQSGYVVDFATATYSLSLNPLGGNVGIGTTSPSAGLSIQKATAGVDALHVVNTGSNAVMRMQAASASFDNYFDYYPSSSSLIFREGGTERMRILEGGNVGIGTTNPSTGHLQVQGTGATQAYIVNSGTNANNYGIDAEATGAGTSNYAGYFAAANATNNYSIFIPANFPVAGANNYAIYSNSAAKSYFAGDVGIGATGPGAKLDINQTTLGVNALNVTYNNAQNPASAVALFTMSQPSNRPVMKLVTSTGGNSTDTHGLMITNGGGGYGLRVNDDGTDSDSTPFIVDASGNVGIGDTSPAAALTVGSDTNAGYANGAGDVYVQNDLEVDGTIYGTVSQAGYLNPSGDNLLYNGDFELGTTGWTGITSIDVSYAGVSGTSTAKVVNSQTLLSDDYIPVDPRYDTLQLEGFFKEVVTGSTPGVLYFGYRAYDGNKTVITTAPCGTYCYFAANSYNIPNDGAWHKFSATTVGEGTSFPNFPVGTKFVRVLALVNYSSLGGETTLVDHITLKRINNGPLFAGNNFSSNNLVNQYQVSKLYTTSSNNFIIEPPSSGFVGIGTASPGAKLQVTDSNAQTAIYNSTSGVGGYITFQSSGTAQGLFGAGGTLFSNNGTGIRAASGVPISFSINSATPSMVVDTTGNVGIGVSSPGEKLEVYGGTQSSLFDANATSTWATASIGAYSGITGSARGIAFYDQSGFSTKPAGIVGVSRNTTGGRTELAFITSVGNSSYERMRIDENGSVGIGTTTPSKSLHIYNSSGDGKILSESQQPGFILKETDTTNTNWWVDNNSGSFRILTVNDALNTWQTAFTISQTTGTPGNFYLNGSVGIGTTSPSYRLSIRPNNNNADGLAFDQTTGYPASIIYEGTGGLSSGWGLTFNVPTSASTQTSILALRGNGNVGIGTTSPAALLSLANTAGTELRLDSTTNTSYSLIRFTESSSLSSGFVEYINSNFATVNRRNYLELGSINASGGVAFWAAGAEKMRLDSDGDLGINTVSPFQKLEIDTDPTNTSQPTAIYTTNADPHTALFLSGTGNAVNEKLGLQIGLWNNGTSKYSIGGLFGVMTSAAGNTIGDLTFDLRSLTSDTALTERMRITSAGNVGIGTTSPATTFSVSGNGYLTGGLGVGVVNTTAGTLVTSGNATIGGSLTLGTDLSVANGGTGASTLTDGGVLLGSGTGAITAMAVLANGSIIVGDGTTDPVALAAFTSSTGDLTHEAGGLEADVSAYTGLLAISGGVTSEVDLSSEVAGQITDETGSGALVFGTSPTFTTSVIMANGATLGQASGPLIAFDDTNNFLEITGASVGIGTTTPQKALSVVSSNGLSVTNNGSGAGNPGTAELNAGTQGSPVSSRLAFGTDGTGWQFRIAQNQAGTITDLLTVVTGGSVGIGTTSPATTFSVSGNGYLTGGLGVGVVNTTAGTLVTSGNATIGGDLDVAGGDITSANIITSDTDATLPHLVLDSTSAGDNWTAQGAYISIGESGALGSASMHLTYTGDGFGYSGAGTVTTGVPAGGYWKYTYNSQVISTPAAVSIGSLTLTTDLSVANGGTGASTLTGVLIGNGTSAVTGTTASSGIAGAITDETGSGALVFGTSPTFTTDLRISAGNGNGIGFWATAPTTYGISMSNSATYQYGDVTDYYIANIMTSGVGRGFVWSYGTVPSMALNANSGNLAIKGALTVNGSTGTSTIANGLTVGGTDLVVQQATGNVGVGTVSPDSLLHIQGTKGNTALKVDWNEANSNTNDILSSIEFGTPEGENGAGAQPVTAYINAVFTRLGCVGCSYEDGGLAFGTMNSTDAGPQERMRITDSGLVGIGTTSPATTFSVSGNGYLTGGLGVGVVNTTAGTITTSGAINGQTISSAASFTGTLTVASTLNANGGLSQDGNVILNGTDTWLRTTGSTGWYSSTYAVGWYATQAGYVKPYNNAAIDMNNQEIINIDWATSDDGSGSGLDADLWDGNQFASYLNQAVLTTSNPTFNSLTLTTDLSVANGGTGASTLTGLLQGNGTSAITGVTGTAGQFPYYNGTNTLLATSTVFLATTGNVGIGTTVPTQKLDVIGNGIFSTSATYQSDVYKLTNAGANYGGGDAPQLTLSSQPGSYAQLLLKGGNGAGSYSPIIGFAHKNSAGNYILGGEIYSAMTTATAGSEVQDLVFSTQSGGTTASEKMRILGSGNVGIGTTTPNSTFQVANTGTRQILISDTNAGADSKHMYIESADGSLRFGELNDALSTPAERMRIDTSGNVGVGGTPSLSKLYVTGSGSTNATVRIHDTSTTQGGILKIGGSFANDFATSSIDFYDAASGTMVIGSQILGVGRTTGILETNPGGLLVFKTKTIGGSLTERMRIDDSGHVTPGADNTQNLGSSSLHWSCLYYDATNLGTCSSDARLKNNINDFSFPDALTKIAGLKPRTFTFNDNPSQSINYGLIAQEVQEIAPELVSVGEDGYLAVRYGYLPYLTVEAIQELNTKVYKINKAEYPAIFIESGEIAAIDGSLVVKATSSSKIFGIASAPTAQSGTSTPISLSGRVPVKVTTEGGPIKIGDRITISSLPGIGAKATTSGQTVGIALENFDPANGQNGSGSTTPETVNILTSPETQLGGLASKSVWKGSILVFVNLAYTQMNPQISGGALSTDFFTIDGTTGKISGLAVFDFGGASLVNVSSIASTGDKWKIDSDGNFVGESLLVRGTIEVGSPDRRTGITLYDESSGYAYCFTVRDGLPTTTSGPCSKSGPATSSPSALPATTDTSSGGTIANIIDSLSQSVSALTDTSQTTTSTTTSDVSSTTTATTATVIDSNTATTTTTTTITDSATTTTSIISTTTDPILIQPVTSTTTSPEIATSTTSTATTTTATP